ncbi:auxin-responsive protein SAUR76, partial [Euphorbia lathyris]|uniref:auxin-responsive protein SAUR76 n=1 Tax=Euphorbia lathyris TaxID=212925 RepID=UPI0033136E19
KSPKKMKKINLILRKCKTLSRQLGRSSSYSSLRSKSTREELWVDQKKEEERKIIFVGSTRKRYVISSKYLSHPLVDALIEKSNEMHKQQQKMRGGGDQEEIVIVKCEVVLFDHLLWMLENADPNLNSTESFQELADLYVF